MRGKRTFLGVILLIALGAMLVAGATSAADPGQQRAPGDLIDRLFGTQIVGTWEATVNRGPVLPPLTSLHTITSDHTLVESGSDTLFRSPSYGVWEYVGNRTYATTMVFHRFNSVGAHIGSMKVNANRRVSEDGETYVGVAVNQVLDLAGNVIGGGRATVTARRMHVESIPDQP